MDKMRPFILKLYGLMKKKMISYFGRFLDFNIGRRH